MREWRRKKEGRGLLKRKKVTMLTSTREDEVKERGVGNVKQEDDLEELDAAVNTFIRFPELRTES